MQKPDIFLLFAEWTATPAQLRQPSAIISDFCQLHHITEQTAATWRKRDDFWNIVHKIQVGWAKDKTPDIIMALYRNAARFGKAPEVKLWLQAFEGFEEKSSNAPAITVIGIEGLTASDASRLTGSELLPVASANTAPSAGSPIAPVTDTPDVIETTLTAPDTPVIVNTGGRIE